MILQKDLLKKIYDINDSVEKTLKAKGYYPPKKNKDGSIRIGAYTIAKDQTGFFSVTDKKNNIIASKINLPHSAVIFANNLALGTVNREILDIDTQYGHYIFDTELFKKHLSKKIKSKNYDQAEIINEKFKISSFKKQKCRDKIVEGFNKLMKIT